MHMDMNHSTFFALRSASIPVSWSCQTWDSLLFNSNSLNVKGGWNTSWDTRSSTVYSYQQATAPGATQICTQWGCTATSERWGVNSAGDEAPGPHFLHCKEIKKTTKHYRRASSGSRGFQTNWQAINNCRPDDLDTCGIAQGKRSYRKSLGHLKSIVSFEIQLYYFIKQTSAESCHLKLLNTVFFCEKCITKWIILNPK